MLHATTLQERDLNLIKNIYQNWRDSQVAQRSKALHRSEASLQTLVQSLAVSQPATTGALITNVYAMRRRTTGPASSGLGEGLAGRNVLVPFSTTTKKHNLKCCYIRPICEAVGHKWKRDKQHTTSLKTKTTHAIVYRPCLRHWTSVNMSNYIYLSLQLCL